jgi:hypothetical protein
MRPVAMRPVAMRPTGFGWLAVFGQVRVAGRPVNCCPRVRLDGFQKATAHLHSFMAARTNFRARVLDLCGYFLVRLANDPPLFHVPPPCPDRNEPAVLNQHFGSAHDLRQVPGAVGTIGADIACSDGGFRPVIYHPAEELFGWRRTAVGQRAYSQRASPYYFRLVELLPGLFRRIFDIAAKETRSVTIGRRHLFLH